MLFDAMGHEDPMTALNEAKASGDLELKVVTIAPPICSTFSGVLLSAWHKS
jgi:hypothetical protein